MFDSIIIGSGPAGISASLYLARAGLKTLVIGMDSISLSKAELIDNYYGVPGINGLDLQHKGIRQAANLGVAVKQEQVVGINWENSFTVTTTLDTYSGKSLVLATGTSRKTPDIKGLSEFEGRGVSYCAVCDGFFYRGKNVCVIGDGQYALHEAQDLAMAKSITILTNGVASSQDFGKFPVISAKILSIEGTEKVTAVRLADNSILEVSGVFIAIGTATGSNLAKKLGIEQTNAHIKVGTDMSTNIPGLFACGDCTGGVLQVAKAVHEGMIAGMSAIKYVRTKI